MANAQKVDIDLELSRLEYDDATRPQRAVLMIETAKSYAGSLRSQATVYWLGLHGRSTCMAFFGGGGDFNRHLFSSAKTVKATQKAIDTQHAQVFTPEVIAGLVQAAKDYYSKGSDSVAA
jgi:hypothetical protein